MNACLAGNFVRIIMLHDLPKGGVVIPCYQEAKRLPQKEYISFAKQSPHIFLLFVNDGSNDGTQAVLEDLKSRAHGNIEVLDLKNNVGKAEAVRQGIHYILKKPDIKFVGFLDADLSTPFAEFEHLLELIASRKNIKMISGSRIRRMGANIERRAFRHYAGRIIATIAGLFIVKIPAYDTQCGAKIFTAEHAQAVFKDSFISRWLFDMEIYCRSIIILGYENCLKSIYEFPLNEWKHVENSKITLKSMLNLPFEMMKIYLKYSPKMKKV